MRRLTVAALLTLAAAAPAATVDIDAAWLAAHGQAPWLLDQAGTTYVLQQDVTSDRTAFAIQADHVTLDLNHHAVTYGSGPVVSVPNGSFESGTAGWDFSGAPHASVEPGSFVRPVQVSDGGSSLNIAFPSPAESIRSAAPIHLSGGRVWFLSAMYYDMMNNGTTRSLSVELDDAATGAALATVAAGGTAWRGFQYIKAIYQPTSDVDVKIRISYAGGSPGGTIYLDDVRITIGPSYGITAAASWAPGSYDNPRGGGGDAALIENGTIIQGAGGGYASHAIYFNQGGGDGTEIAHIASTVWGPNSINVEADYHGGFLVHDNVLTNRVKVIENRDEQQGALIRIGNDATRLGADLIHDNTLIGGAQCGINVSGGPGIQIYGNDISQDAYYTNDFAIMINAAGVVAHDNYIHPTCGRGIHIATANVEVHHNRLVMQELPRNQEYNGTQALGTYGIQLEDAASGALVHDNDVTVDGGAAGGACLRLTDLAAGAGNRVYHNTFTAIGTQGQYQTVDVSSNFHGDGAVAIEDTLMTADQTNVMIPWDGNLGLLLQGDTLAKGPGADATYHTLWYETSSPATGTALLDDVFVGGADPTDARLIPIGYGGWGGPEDYTLQWTLDLTVLDAAGHPAAGAAVTVKDAHGATVFTGATDAGGMAHPHLAQWRRYNSAAQAVNIDATTPHLVSAALGATSASASVTMDARKALTLRLGAGGGSGGGSTGGATSGAGASGASGGHQCGLGGSLAAALAAMLALRRGRQRDAA